MRAKRDSYADFGLDFANRGRRYKGSLETTLDLGDDALRHRITAAADVEREEFRNATPSPFAFQGWRHTDNVGLVAQYELQAGDAFTFGASLRHDENDRFGDPTTWRAQASYAFATARGCVEPMAQASRTPAISSCSASRTDATSATPI